VSWVRYSHALQLAASDDDVEAVRRIDRLYRELDPTAAQRPQWRWIVAVAQGDSVARAAELEDLVAGEGWYPPFVAFALALGRHLEDAEIAASVGHRSRRPSYDPLVRMTFARSRGRHGRWLRNRESLYQVLSPPEAAARRIRDALYFGGPRDASLEAATEMLARIADRQVSPPSPAVSALARCWLTQREVGGGDVERVERTARFLRDSVPYPGDFAVCAALLQAHRARSLGQDVRDLAVHLDTLVRSDPSPWQNHMPAGKRSIVWADPAAALNPHDISLDVANLYLSDLLLEIGDTSAALAASRRRPHFWASVLSLEGGLTDFLRREARLLTLTGDTAGAIAVYDHYLALRGDPPNHPPWRAEWDSVKAELAELVAQ
jgi:hypothetical protein